MGGIVRWRVNSAGNVGIGSSNPIDQFVVEGGGAILCRIIRTTNGDRAVLRFQANNESGAARYADLGVDPDGYWFGFDAPNSHSGGLIGTDGDPDLAILVGGNVGIGTTIAPNKLTVAGTISPSADNTYSLGTASLRVSTVYAGTGAINTSDARYKTWRGALTEAEYQAGLAVIDELGFYQWNDAILEKGADGARLHFGVRAQQVWSIFAANGLVDPIGDNGKPGATPYGFLCFDEWDAQRALVPGEDDEPVSEGPVILEGGDRYGIRYDDLALFLIAVQAKRQAELEAEIGSQAAAIMALQTAVAALEGAA